MTADFRTPERPLRRSSSQGSRRGNLTVSTLYEAHTPRRRHKRLVLAAGQRYPGHDNVELSPRPEADGPKTPRRVGKKMTHHTDESTAGKGSIFRTGSVRNSAKKKVPQRPSQAILQHVDAECGFEAAPSRAEDMRSQRRERLAYHKETTLTRREDEPIGLTIDENLYVTNVVEGTAAHAAGLKAGTKLASVDGVKVVSQSEAVEVLRHAGAGVRIGLAQEATSQSMKEDGVIAGVPTGYDGSQRRMKRASATANEILNRGAPFGSQSDVRGGRGSSPHPRPEGLGPPGLGPQPTPWTEVDEDKPYGYQRPGNDIFKPNLYIPPLGRPTTPRRMANKTTYELCEDRGETFSAASPRVLARGRQRVSGAENRNGDIITNDPIRQPSVSPAPLRRGKDRAASPAVVRPPASGAPVGNEDPHPTGRRRGNLPENTQDMLRYDGGSSIRARSYSAGAATPRRMVWTPVSHGDIIGHTYGDAEGPSPRGLRRAPTKIELPKPQARVFIPSPRHQVAQPAPSDIFNQREYRGGNQDLIDHRYASDTRGGSPRNVSRLHLVHSQPSREGGGNRAPSPQPGTPRRGKGAGTLAPRQPPGDYAPWGDRA